MKHFPDSLLPPKNGNFFKKDEIKDKKAARWHNPEKSGSIFDQDGSIKTELIHYRRFPGFSINLKPPSTCQDLKIRLLNRDLEEEWKPGDFVPDVNQSDFELIEKREVFEFNTNDITSAELSYLINDNPYILKIEIIHKPLKANYAHCEFKLVPTHPDSSSEIEKLTSSKAYHRLLILNLRSLMEKYCQKCN